MERTGIISELEYNRNILERRRVATRIGIEAHKLALSLREVAKDISSLCTEINVESINMSNIYNDVYTNTKTLTLRTNSIVNRVESLIRSTNND